jgi:surface polysaccharide O-acyltransferase-like enzyme
VYIHFWYLNMLLGLTLLAPLINRAALRMRPSATQAGLLLLAFTMLMAWNQIATVTAGTPQDRGWLLSLPWYAGYFAAGYLIDTCQEGLKVGNRFAAGAIVLAAAAGIGLNYAACHTFGVISDDFILSDTGPMVFVITTGIFVLVRRNRHLFRASPMIRALSEASFGIYLLHPLVIYTVQNYFSSYFQYGFLFMPLTFAFTLATSFCIIYGVRKLRAGRFVG